MYASDAHIHLGHLVVTQSVVLHNWAIGNNPIAYLGTKVVSLGNRLGNYKTIKVGHP